ncbi:flagellar hook-associated protein 3 [Thermodesulfobium narugense DSM 14796]|uniref:Flagellar hook-associated protein 3 n=1 Tax=Thermodesulfobium narugense DSM 14796 TaxID=747365 RepID=M1E928_9BACT|nr:flagellar hook-associated protein FlgL [Thermodesulfobium narugense]AEE15300.1 flagellar hook-associated protein 3 [Thermodesulfobium narugense DSM 14796]
MSRVTMNMMINQFNSDLNNQLISIAKDSYELSSGNAIQLPQDNPVSNNYIMSFKEKINGINNYQNNITAGQSILNSTDSALTSISTILNNANTIALQGANVTNQDSLASLEKSVEALKQSLLSVANTSVGNTYIFAGSKSSSAPFSLDSNGNVVYLGDSASINYSVEPGATTTVNIDGTQLLPIFKALDNLQLALKSGNQVTISNTVSDIQNAIKTVNDLQSIVGSRQNMMQYLSNYYSNALTNYNSILANYQDVDFPTVVTDYATRQTAYQAALKVGAQILPQSLVNYLQ